MDYRFFLVLLLAVLGCEATRPALPGRSDGQVDPHYLTTPSTYVQDSLTGHLTASKTAGIVVHTSLAGRLRQPLGGRRDLAGLTAVLDRHPDWYPVLTTYFGGRMYAGFCSGEREEDIVALANWCKHIDGPVGLVVGYQVNSPTWELPAGEVTAGYRCLADRLREQGATNIQFGWSLSSLYPGYADSSPMDYYPGADYVDFIATDLARFTSDHFLSETSVFTRSDLARVEEIATDLALPIIITEANPTATYELLPSSADGVYEEFYAPLAEVFEQHRHIAAFSVVPGNIPDSTSHDRFLTAFLRQ